MRKVSLALNEKSILRCYIVFLLQVMNKSTRSSYISIIKFTLEKDKPFPLFLDTPTPFDIYYWGINLWFSSLNWQNGLQRSGLTFYSILLKINKVDKITKDKSFFFWRYCSVFVSARNGFKKPFFESIKAAIC